MRRALAVVLFALVTVLSPCQQPQNPTELTIEAIFAEGGITGRGPETIKWSPDGAKVSFVQRDDSGTHGQLWYIDVATGHKAVLVAENKLQSLAPPPSALQDERQREWITRYSVASYQWAPDSSHLLFDSRGQLWYYSLATGAASQLTSSSDPSSDPKFSPDGKRLSYVRKHEIWVRPVEGKGVERQITTGADDNLLNGEVDWVYAEELSVRSNYFWSPQGKQIVFLQMNEKPVPTYPIVDWIPVHPKVSDEKYPKAGDPNPEVRVGVVSAEGGKVRWISLGQDRDIYIPRFGWVQEGVLYVEVLNRLQDKLELYFVDAASGRSRLMLAENEPDAWVNVEELRLLNSGDGFLLPGWRDGHTHIYLYRFDKSNPLATEARLERQLTQGEFEVADVVALDDANAYFTANADDPRQQHLYAVKLAGGPMQKITQEPGTHSATFSRKTTQYFVDNYSALLSPPRLSLCKVGAPSGPGSGSLGSKVGGTCSAFWQARAVTQYNLIAPTPLELKAADGTTTLYGYLLLPPGAETTGRKLPLILNPYGGPGAQSVRNAWGGSGFLFRQIMARRGFATLIVDNRGMGGRGKQFAAALRHHFGSVELQDQLAALDQVLARFPMLDGERLGWWGWSYGGYMTLYAMTHSNRIKAGISGAPVTDWRLYDTIYTERYMGLPRDNESGYKDSSPVHFAKELNGRLLEVHGTSDDNVHFQNTIQMVRNLVLAGKQFDLQLYPGKTHGVSGSRENSQLYHRVQEHFERWLSAP